MSTPLKVVALCGGTSRPSRTLALTEATISDLKHLFDLIGQDALIDAPVLTAERAAGVFSNQAHALRKIA